MHANIQYSKSISRTLRYHEIKIDKGYAEVLYAANFIKDSDQLNKADIAYYFKRRTSMNHIQKNKLLHLTLSFNPADNLSSEAIGQISREYMNKVGWGHQPYVVFRHMDSLFPHVHIASAIIQRNGRPLKIKYKDFALFMATRREMTRSYQLQPPFSEQKHSVPGTRPIEKLVLGKTPIIPTMGEVVTHVVNQYKFTSLEEMNAVLCLYNIEAYGGKEGSVLKSRNGLVYRALDDEGRNTKRMVKSSYLPGKPTLWLLQQKFVENQRLREAHKPRIMSAIEWSFNGQAPSLKAFRQHLLKKEQIFTRVQKDKEGQPADIWYVDFTSKAVFSGSQLGERYTAAAIQKRCIPEEEYQQIQEQTLKQTLQPKNRLRL